MNKIDDYLRRVENLKSVLEIQCRHGNYDQSEYMRGMANGLKLAMSIFTDNPPDYFEPPETTMLKVIQK